MTTTRRVAVRGIIFKDGKLLCQKLTAYRRQDRDFWCTPGGGLDDGETLQAGLSREMVEETGIVPKIGRLLFVQQFTEDGEKEQMEFFFHIENADDYQNIDLAATTHGEEEIEQVEFIAPREHFVLPKFLQTVDIQKYIDGTLPPLVYNELDGAANG